MSLVKIGPSVLDLDDIRAIIDHGKSVVVTFRDGSSMMFEGEHADSLRAFVTCLPDGIPLSGRDVAQGEPGVSPVIHPVRRKERN